MFEDTSNKVWENKWLIIKEVILFTKFAKYTILYYLGEIMNWSVPISKF